MIEYLPDTNVFSKVFKGDQAVTTFVENLDAAIDTTIYIECLQGSKSNQEKRIIKKFWIIFRFCRLRREFRSAQWN